jgi:hypothetical protein
VTEKGSAHKSTESDLPGLTGSESEPLCGSA